MEATPDFNDLNKTAKTKNAKRILRDYEERYGVPITGADAEFVTYILQKHPSFESKIASVENIDHHVVRPIDRGSRGFRTKRRDTGMEIEWSYITAVDGKKPSSETKVKKAFRGEVDPWIEKAGAAYDAGIFGGVCYLSNKIITDPLNTELHHHGDWPFWRIVREFVLDENLGWDNIAVENRKELSRELVGVFQLVDRELAARWVEHHAEHAEIVRVLKDAHKTETKAEGNRRRGSHYGKLEFPDSPEAE